MAENPTPPEHLQVRHAQDQPDDLLPSGWGKRMIKPSIGGVIMQWPPPSHIRAVPPEPEPIQQDAGEEPTVKLLPRGTDEGEEQDSCHQPWAPRLVYDTDDVGVSEGCAERSTEGREVEEGNGPVLEQVTESEGERVCLAPWYELSTPEDDTLIFDSRFEGGNLAQAVRVGEFAYDLFLRPDTNTNGHTQWFYFSIRNAQKGVAYRMSVQNFYKNDSLYGRGMRPLFYSTAEASSRNVGWVRGGEGVTYKCKGGTGAKDYSVSFSLRFPHGPSDLCFVAYSYPFTYTDLNMYLHDLMHHPQRSMHVRRRSMCTTPMGNSVDLLTITAYDESTPFKDRKGIVISARVHPGESTSSFTCKGLIDFLTSDTPEAQVLRQAYVFKVVPMLNPDGVVLGNHRCGVAGLDLNRQWIDPSPRVTPEIYSLKRTICTFQQDREVVLYVDLHNHSKAHNAFVYGCVSDGASDAALSGSGLHLFPQRLSQLDPSFCLRDCSFEVERGKHSAGRVVVHRELGIPHSYTLEASFLGPNLGPLEGCHFNTRHYEQLGEAMGRAIFRAGTVQGLVEEEEEAIGEEQAAQEAQGPAVGNNNTESQGSDTGDSAEEGEPETDEAPAATGRLLPPSNPVPPRQKGRGQGSGRTRRRAAPDVVLSLPSGVPNHVEGPAAEGSVTSDNEAGRGRGRRGRGEGRVDSGRTSPATALRDLSPKTRRREKRGRRRQSGTGAERQRGRKGRGRRRGPRELNLSETPEARAGDTTTQQLPEPSSVGMSGKPEEGASTSRHVAHQAWVAEPLRPTSRQPPTVRERDQLPEHRLLRGSLLPEVFNGATLLGPNNLPRQPLPDYTGTGAYRPPYLSGVKDNRTLLSTPRRPKVRSLVAQGGDPLNGRRSSLQGQGQRTSQYSTPPLLLIGAAPALQAGPRGLTLARKTQILREPLPAFFHPTR